MILILVYVIGVQWWICIILNWFFISGTICVIIKKCMCCVYVDMIFLLCMYACTLVCFFVVAVCVHANININLWLSRNDDVVVVVAVVICCCLLLLFIVTVMNSTNTPNRIDMMNDIKEKQQQVSTHACIIHALLMWYTNNSHSWYVHIWIKHDAWYCITSWWDRIHHSSYLLCVYFLIFF